MPEEVKTSKVLVYKGFKGPQTKIYPKLLKEYRRPLNIYDVSELISLKDSDFIPFMKYLFKHNLDTRDGILYHPSQKIKICLDPEPSLNLTSLSKLERGALIISQQDYESLDGEEYSFTDLESLLSSESTVHKEFQDSVNKFLLRGSSGISLGNMILDYEYLKKPSRNILLRSLTLGTASQTSTRYSLDGSLPLNRKEGYLIGRLLDISKKFRVNL